MRLNSLHFSNRCWGNDLCVAKTPLIHLHHAEIGQIKDSRIRRAFWVLTNIIDIKVLNA